MQSLICQVKRSFVTPYGVTEINISLGNGSLYAGCQGIIETTVVCLSIIHLETNFFEGTNVLWDIDFNSF